MAEILLYSDIYDFTAEQVVSQLEQYKGQPITLRINSGGGGVTNGYSILAKMQEAKKPIDIKVDGMAASMAAFMLCYSNNVECLDVSTFLLHRAAFPEYMENNADQMNDGMWAYLNNMNASLRAALEAKINTDMWEAVTGTTLDALFSNDGRMDVTLTAAQAKQLGLVNKVTPLTAATKQTIEAKAKKVNAQVYAKVAAFKAPQSTTTNNQPNHMDRFTIKAQYPDAYKAIRSKAINEERERVNAWMVYIDVDAEKVKAGIASGNKITNAETQELLLKSVGVEALAKVTDGNAPAIIPAAGANGKQLTAEQREQAEFEARLKAISQKA
jgi:ATP-dependent protease ClpP protease subunit